MPTPACGADGCGAPRYLRAFAFIVVTREYNRGYSAALEFGVGSIRQH